MRKKNETFKCVYNTFLCFVLILAWCFDSCVSQTHFDDKNTFNTSSSGIKTFLPENTSTLRLFKRSAGKRCANSSECSSDINGSVCVQNTCVCPQGHLPTKKGSVGCFQVDKQLGNYCNTSSQCGEDLTCKKNKCWCPDGYQLFRAHGTKFCLFWHRPTRLVDRCRSHDDCNKQDPNALCKKRWCQCNHGYELFETTLYGRKHRCFKTKKFQCSNHSHCSVLSDSPDVFCTCYVGLCHCLANLNFTAFDFPLGDEPPTWYQRWKKDLILATRLLFITVILFFVPCFIYVTLGMRQRRRQLFSPYMQPARSPIIHYTTQRRSSQLRSLPSYRGLSGMVSAGNLNPESHHVEILLNANGVNSRLVTASRPRVYVQPQALGTISSRTSESSNKEDDMPPSYEEIVEKEVVPEEPPPPYPDPQI